MAKFNYTQDQLIKVWERRTFTIEADTQEEADEIAKRIAKTNYQVYSEDEDSILFNNNEILYDTEENLLPEENNGYFTMEVFRDSDLDTPVARNA